MKFVRHKVKLHAGPSRDSIHHDGTKIKNANSQSFRQLLWNQRRSFSGVLRLSPASNYMEELVTGPGGLPSREIEDHPTNYGALPRTKRAHGLPISEAIADLLLAFRQRSTKGQRDLLCF